MSKKGRMAAIFLTAAAAGLGITAGEKLYSNIMVPKARKEDEPDFSELVTKGRMFVRNHPDHQDIYLESIDLLKLHAVFIAAENKDDHRYALLIHGYNDHCESMGIYAEHYKAQGMNLLLPDLRGYGKSEGGCVGFGYDDRLDIIEWIYWILKRDPEAKIFLHGVSMGAATVFMTLGETLPENVVFAVADSSYSDLKTEFSRVHIMSKSSALPFDIAWNILRAMTKLRAGYDLDDVCPLKAAARAVTPILILHGDADRLIPVSMANELLDACSSRTKKIATFAGADHLRGVVTDPAKYWNEIDTALTEAGLL